VGRIAQIVLCLVLVAIVDVWISLVATCQSDQCGAFSGPLSVIAVDLFRFIEEHDKGIVAFFTIVLAVSTIGLWLSTGALWSATRDAAKRQERDTEILQRAYVAAELGGIRDMTPNGQLVGHVIFRNVGHLPATNLRDVVKEIEIHDGAWRPPTIPDTELEEHGVLPIGVKMTKGSGGLIFPGAVEASSIVDKYLYVWGRMTYVDGFKRPRYLNFCHRYPWAAKDYLTGGRLFISEEHGRYHEFGRAMLISGAVPTTRWSWALSKWMQAGFSH
jgi:hypothetical protein